MTGRPAQLKGKILLDLSNTATEIRDVRKRLAELEAARNALVVRARRLPPDERPSLREVGRFADLSDVWVLKLERNAP